MADFEINKRLRYLITEVFKMTPHKFSSKYDDKGGVKTSQVLRERNGLSNKLLEDILKAYPSINKVWLLTGEGDMLIDKDAESTGKILNEPPVKYKSGTDALLENQARLISMQEQLMLNNTKLVETNSKITEQLIEFYKKQEEAESRTILENVKKEIENLKRELKNSPARGDAGCANAG